MSNQSVSFRRTLFTATDKWDDTPVCVPGNEVGFFLSQSSLFEYCKLADVPTERVRIDTVVRDVVIIDEKVYLLGDRVG